MATIPSVLAARVWGTAGNTQAYYLQGGTTLSQIGPDVGVAVPAYPGDNTRFQANMAIKFQGQRFCVDLSLASTIRIRQYNKYSNTWDIVLAVTISGAVLLGIYPYQESGGVSGIFLAYSQDNGANWSVSKTTDGVSWTTTSCGAVVAIQALNRAHMHRNKLVFGMMSGGGIISWSVLDPVGSTISNVTAVSDGTIATSTTNAIPSYATFNNRLFMLFTRATATGTTVAVGSNGVNINTFVGAGVLNVASTTGFPTSGTLNVTTTTPDFQQVVTYTGVGATTFTGCNTTGAGVLATGGIVTSGDVATAQLYELVGGVWSSVVSMGTNSTITSAASTTLTAGAHALLPIGSTKLVGIIRGDISPVGTANSTGTRAYDLTPSGATFTVAEVTTTLIPAALRPGGGSGTALQRWNGFVDDVTIPGTPAVFAFLWSDDIPAGSISYYEYTNSSTTLIPGSLGPAANVAIPSCTWGGGSYVAADGDLDVWITGLAAILGGSRESYKASGLISALSQRDSVRLATTGVLPGVVTPAGVGVGHTLTGSTVALTVDGVTTFTTALHAGIRFLVKNQVATSDNGIYTLTSSVGVAWVLTRATDFDADAEVYSGAFLHVGQGTANANTNWQLTTANPITVDTTGLTFTQMTTQVGVLLRTTCRLAANAALPACTAAGSGVGKTLTGDAVGILTVDSVATVLGDRLVIPNQANAADNGFYTVTTEGTAGAAFVLTRATNFDVAGAGEVMPGAYAYVTAGTDFNNTVLELTTDGQIVVDTTLLTFASVLPASWAVWYSTPENTNMTQGTLYGTATGGVSTRVVNQINRVTPDGVTPFTADWRSGTGGDGLQSGQAVVTFPRVNI